MKLHGAAKVAKIKSVLRGSDAYKNHRPGSRKGKVHQIFDIFGIEEAMKFGQSVEIRESTLNNWISIWRREARQLAEKLADRDGSDE